MNFEQIHTTARSECEYLTNPEYVIICISALAGNTQALDIFDSFQDKIANNRLKAKVVLAGSYGYYDLEPMILVEKPGHFPFLYNNASKETTGQIVDDCLTNGDPAKSTGFCNLSNKSIAGIPNFSGIPLFSLQNRIALRNCGFIDPANIHHYILRGGGYQGLARCLKMSQTEVIEEQKKSGLRCKGSTGFLTGEKWGFYYDAKENEKFVVCNAVDGDPKALTARLLLESDPHSVLEGVLIGAYAIGASRCYISVAEEYQYAVERLEIALKQMREYGLLGNNILGSTFSAEIEIKTVKRSLISGEETALLRAIEGKQAMPDLCISYPTMNGLMGKPTLVNNIETFANVSAVFKGTVRDSATGTEVNKGTKVITLSGKAVHKYTVEVPFGTDFRNIVMGIGGGVQKGKKIKAIQFGGPTGAYFDADSLNNRINYELIKEAESIIGSGTVEVFDNDSCAVEMAEQVMAYLQTQSCGKCVFCREGTLQISEILKDIIENGGKPKDLELVEELGEMMKASSICGLGKTAANPILSSIRLFRNEYDFHTKEKKCLASDKARTPNE